MFKSTRSYHFPVRKFPSASLVQSAMLLPAKADDSPSAGRSIPMSLKPAVAALLAWRFGDSLEPGPP